LMNLLRFGNAAPTKFDFLMRCVSFRSNHLAKENFSSTIYRRVSKKE
jgi:hypothetical protein